MRDVNTFTLVEHLAELRKRIFAVLIAFLVGASISYSYIQPIMDELISVGKTHFDFIYISPPELFIAYIKVALLFGLIIASPIIFLQIWIFIKPGLEKKEQRYLLLALFAGVLFFLIGVIFSYKVVLPVTLQFFGGMTMEDIRPMISVASYIGFISSTVLSLGIVFEMPMVVLFLSKLGFVTSQFLRSNRKYMALVIFIVAAIITPPDVISQTLLAIPMLILYEISIILSRLTERKKNKTIHAT